MKRGQYDQPGDEVHPERPSFCRLSSCRRDKPGRRDWTWRAGWCNDHPLTARVTVNRFWQQVFGIDWSRRAMILELKASRPLILNCWIAGLGLRSNGWNVKRLMRQLVTSAAFKQAGTVAADAFAKDPPQPFAGSRSSHSSGCRTVRGQCVGCKRFIESTFGWPWLLGLSTAEYLGNQSVTGIVTHVITCRIRSRHLPSQSV